MKEKENPRKQIKETAGPAELDQPILEVEEEGEEPASKRQRSNPAVAELCRLLASQFPNAAFRGTAEAFGTERILEKLEQNLAQYPKLSDHLYAQPLQARMLTTMLRRIARTPTITSGEGFVLLPRGRGNYIKRPV